MRLYEIPVYAFTRQELRNKLDERIKSLKESYPRAFEESQSAERMVCGVNFPYGFFDHNYIVGYIDISYSNDEILFSIFKVYDKKKLRWNTKKKCFFYNIDANGYHFYVNDMNNEVIRKELDLYLQEIAQLCFPGRIVDREIFDNLNAVLDYQNLFKI